MTDSNPAPNDAAATARAKYHCPACGGEANWNPIKQALVCPFCGTESPADLKERGVDAPFLVERERLRGDRKTLAPVAEHR